MHVLNVTKCIAIPNTFITAAGDATKYMTPIVDRANDYQRRGDIDHEGIVMVTRTGLYDMLCTMYYHIENQGCRYVADLRKVVWGKFLTNSCLHKN